MKAKMGRLIPVENKQRKFGSALGYFAVRVENQDGGEEECLLFTDVELKEARERAKKNKEDLLKVSLLRDALD